MRSRDSLLRGGALAWRVHRAPTRHCPPWLSDRSEVAGTLRHMVFISLSAAVTWGDADLCEVTTADFLTSRLKDKGESEWVSGPRAKNKAVIISWCTVVTRKFVYSLNLLFPHVGPDLLRSQRTSDHDDERNGCTKLHGNPPNSCWDISLKTTDVNLIVAIEEKSRDHQSQ